MRERLAFEQAERDSQRLAEDQAEYKKYIQGVAAEQLRVPRAYRIAPLSFDEWRKYLPEDESDPVLRGQLATNRALTARLREDERATVLADSPDTEFELPAEARGLSMNIEEARKFAREQAETFVSQNSDYFPSKKNFETITNYLSTQGIAIPTVDTFKLAWQRLRTLGLIEERPTPEPTQVQPEPQPEPEVPKFGDFDGDLVSGFDLTSGEPCTYTQRQVRNMSSAEFRRAFRVVPRFTRSRYQ